MDYSIFCLELQCLFRRERKGRRMGWDAKGRREGLCLLGFSLVKFTPGDRALHAGNWQNVTFYHISGFKSPGNGLGYVSPFRVSVSSFLASSASSGFCRKSIAVRAMILAA